MKTKLEKTDAVTMPDCTVNRSVSERFIVFVAGGTHPIIDFENYHRAERLALIFAGLTNVRMEVFDSQKEICYFIEPTEAKGSFIH